MLLLQKPAEGEEFQDPLDDILCMECGGAQDEDLTLLCEGTFSSLKAKLGFHVSFNHQCSSRAICMLCCSVLFPLIHCMATTRRS